MSGFHSSGELIGRTDPQNTMDSAPTPAEPLNGGRDDQGGVELPLPAISASPARPEFQATSEETLVDRTCKEYLAEIAEMPEVTLPEIRDVLLGRLSEAFEVETTMRKHAKVPAPKLVKPRVLPHLVVVLVLMARGWFCQIDFTDGDGDEDTTVLAVYQHCGPDEGLYVSSTAVLARSVSEFRPSSTSREIDSILNLLKMHAPVVRRTKRPALVPVNNGVFDHDLQKLLPFSPDWVFTSKSRVDYVSHAQSPVIKNADGTDWEVEEWMESLSDDLGVVELLWEMLSASVRPFVPWGLSVWLLSIAGNNGKGTLLVLVMNLIGKESVASLGLADFGKEFQLTKLLSATAVLCDENDVGEFSDRNGYFKAAVTGDPIRVNRKFKTPVIIQFRGLVIQCFNERPRVKDKSGSFLRRILIVPFKQSFRGIENKSIKNDYLHRPEVLQYVLWRVLSMTHTELSEPPVCALAKAEYEETNNPKLAFWLEIKDQLAWDLVPFRFIHDLYVSWSKRTNPSGHPESQNSLTSFLKELLANDPEWEHGGDRSFRPGLMISKPEHLISEYNLPDEWRNHTYTGKVLNKLCLPTDLKPNYRGLIRRLPAAPAAGIGIDDDSNEA